MAYVDPRSLKQVVLSFVSYSPERPNYAAQEVVSKHAIDLHGTSSREQLFRDFAASMLPLVDQQDTEYRHCVRTYLGMTQVLSALIIRQPNGNFWKVAHYT